MPLVILTGRNDKTSLALESSLILTVGKGPGGLVTIVQTGLNTPKGPLCFEVAETVEEVVEAVYKAQGATAPPAATPKSLLSS